MGRRSRKRESSAAAALRREAGEAPVPPVPSVRRRSRRGDAPPAPWGRFPLVELCVLAALVLGVFGLIRHDGSSPIILLCALAIGSLAGLELAIREHFGGYKPHATVLAAAVALVPLAVLFFAHASRFLLPPVALAVFGVAFWALRGLYKRRAGGLGYR